MHSKEYEFSAVTLGWLCYPMSVDIVANIVCWWLFKLVPLSIPFHSIALRYILRLEWVCLEWHVPFSIHLNSGYRVETVMKCLKWASLLQFYHISLVVAVVNTDVRSFEVSFGPKLRFMLDARSFQNSVVTTSWNFTV